MIRMTFKEFWSSIGGDKGQDPLIDQTASIHRWAEVMTGTVAIGARTRVWQFASVIRGAVIGADCSIAAYAIVDGSHLGDRCIVSHAAFIDPGIQIGNDVFIGPLAALCNDGWPRVDKTDFDMEALINGDHVCTIISDGASIGAGAIILPGVIIGCGAMVAAGAVVNRDVPNDKLWKRDGTFGDIDESLIRRMRKPSIEGWPGRRWNEPARP